MLPTAAELSPAILLSTVVYTLVGIVLMVGTLFICDKLFSLNLRKELIKDHNVAFGIVMAGACVAIALIIAAAIS